MPMGFHFGPMRTYGGRGSVDASAARSDARTARSEVDMMELEVERLLMITEALWGMLKEQHGYTDEQLIARIAEIDMRDGKIDGRVNEKEGPLKCPNCGRTLSRQRPTCLYCGTAVARDPFAR